MSQQRRRAMQDPTERLDWLVVAGSKARWALAVIRMVNGAIALVAPSVIVKRFGEIPGESAAAIYGLRLFGVRTVLIGADLVTQRGRSLLHVTRQAVVIHASDTMTVAGLSLFGRLRPRMAIPLALISAMNTVLATISWLASRRQEQSWPPVQTRWPSPSKRRTTTSASKRVQVVRRSGPASHLLGCACSRRRWTSGDRQ